MHTLSAVADKAEYVQHMGTVVKLGRKEVKIIEHEKDGRSGSYERGFKFSTTKYGGLKNEKTGEVSFDHGTTWVRCYSDFYDTPFKATKTGRIRISSSSRNEFAFDSIQSINRQYDPRYKWKP